MAANDKLYLSMSVLASLGGRHLTYLAGMSFNHDHGILPQRGTLNWVRA